MHMDNMQIFVLYCDSQNKCESRNGCQRLWSSKNYRKCMLESCSHLFCKSQYVKLAKLYRMSRVWTTSTLLQVVCLACQTRLGRCCAACISVFTCKTTTHYTWQESYTHNTQQETSMCARYILGATHTHTHTHYLCLLHMLRHHRRTMP
jgi:hypothetical protein